MLVHFPVALWPAHFGLHLLGGLLPPGVAGIAGFWLLVGGTGLGWLAAVLGGLDCLALQRADDPRLADALKHGFLNGSVLLAFTGLLAAEYPSYPVIAPGAGLLGFEALLLAVLGVGNYFGGAVVWRKV